jgi:hypothetical protein
MYSQEHRPLFASFGSQDIAAKRIWYFPSSCYKVRNSAGHINSLVMWSSLTKAFKERLKIAHYRYHLCRVSRLSVGGFNRREAFKSAIP